MWSQSLSPHPLDLWRQGVGKARQVWFSLTGAWLVYAGSFFSAPSSTETLADLILTAAAALATGLVFQATISVWNNFKELEEAGKYRLRH